VGVGLFVLIAAVVVVIAVLQWRAKLQRREDLATWAFKNNLSYAADDPYNLPYRYAFSLFGKGEGRGAENVLSGDWKGVPVIAADYWYYTESRDSEGRTTRDYDHFSIVITRIEAMLPCVRIEREGVFSRLADAIGLRDIEFESEDFNRRFNVRCDDREFAFKLLDARMIQWLLSESGDVCVEVNGPDVLLWCKRLKPTELAPLLYRAKGFVEKVPRLVWAEYGKAAS